MNTGVVSSRYAKAFLQFVKENGRGEEVFMQVREILAHPESLPEPLEPDIVRLISLLRQQRRTDYLKLILNTFVRDYCKEEGIVLARVVTAVPSEDLADEVRSLLETKTGKRVLMESSVDPSLLGGFVVEFDDYRLDASVQRQLDDIRRQFVQKNNRII